MNKLNKALELLENAQRRARENDDVPTCLTIQLAMAHIENHLDELIATALRDRPRGIAKLRLVSCR